MDRALATAADAVDPAALGLRTLPVPDAWAPLLPAGALVRGRSIACTGLAAPTLALSLVAEAVREGAWLAVVDLPWIGVEAAGELGVPLERLGRGDVGRRGREGRGELWGEAVAAALDGFDCLLTRVPAGAPAGLVRRLQVRLRSRGGVLVAVGDPGPLGPEVTVAADDLRWEGLGRGHGHLRSRRLAATVTGRRVPRPRRGELLLPAPGGAVTEAPVEPTVLHPTGPRPRTRPHHRAPASALASTPTSASGPAPVAG